MPRSFQNSTKRINMKVNFKAKLSITVMLFCVVTSAFSEQKDSDLLPGVIRTPDSRFQNLPDFPFEPHYIYIDGLRIHYLDEGPKDADPIFLLHGEPEWSYIFREMIPVLTAAGHRVIAPDMVGFGRSDKFISIDDYSYQHHVDVMSELVRRLDLQETTFFGQDWGGLVGLRVVGALPARFSRVVVSNTGLPSATGILSWVLNPIFKLKVLWDGPTTLEEFMLEGFGKWPAYAYYNENIDVGGMMALLGNGVDADEAKAYDAPFPDSRYKAGVRVFPYLIPSQLRENENVWVDVFEKWEKPFLIAFTDEDPVSQALPFMEQDFRTRIPNPTRVVIEGVGHFVQEEVGPQLADLINDFIANKPVRGFRKNGDRADGNVLSEK